MFVNDKLEATELALGVNAQLNWQYNFPMNVPQYYSAVCQKTSQNDTMLTIQNLSATFDLTVYLNPAPDPQHSQIVIKANDRTPVNIVHNWNGAKLKLSNISQECATCRATLIDMG